MEDVEIVKLIASNLWVLDQHFTNHFIFPSICELEITLRWLMNGGGDAY